MRLVTNIIQLLRLVRRELRGGLRGFGVFLTCLFLGTFAISAVGSFTESAKSGLLADAGALLGGDIEVRLVHRELPDAAIEFLAARGALSHVVTLRTMVAGPENKKMLVELKAVDAPYPLYGRIGIMPDQAITTALAERGRPGALVEQALLTRLGVSVGDAVKVGTAEFEIRGVIDREPDRTVRAFNLGPRLMISLDGLNATGLLTPGSLVYHAYRLRLPDREMVDPLQAELGTAFPEAGWRIRSWREATPRVRFFLDRMNQNLSLIGLCALLVGGLGVSGAVRGYLAGKTPHIATMKCLGAPKQLVFTAYLTQILLLGALGAAAGLVCGAAVPYLVARLIGNHLPIPVVPALHARVLATSAAFGLLTALAFSLKALGIASRVSPAVLFRGYGELEALSPGRATRLAIAVAVLALAALAVMTSTDRKMAFWFICGAALCFVVFRYAAAGLVRLAGRLPRPQHPALRLGLGNLHRRGSPAASALFSLGLGLTALVIVTLVQVNLDDKVSDTLPQDAPSFFFLDLQPHQVEQFDTIAQKIPGLRKAERYPTLRGRITAIAEVPVDRAEIAQEVQWAVRGDRFLSYTAKKPDDITLSQGTWWDPGYRGDPLVSITTDLARGFGVKLGDTLTVNVLGREVKARIASIREVDWSTLDLNFALLFSPGVLEGAPQTFIATLHVPPEQEEATFTAMTTAFDNVSVISTRELLKNVSQTLDRIGAAFRSMAAIAVLTGFLVLAGAISADQHRRIHDAVIFKVCGATRRDILSAFAAEFVLIGAVAGAMSAGVGSLAALGIVKGLMKTAFSLHPATIAVTIIAGVALTLVLGLIGTWKALGHKPAEYLRSE